MSLPVVVIRPEPGLSATLSAAAALGLPAWGVPLSEIRPVDWEPVPRGAIDALLLGSANAVRHGGQALALYRGMPAYVVGDATADAAQEAGLALAAVGQGGLQDVLDGLREPNLRLLRLSAAEHVALQVPAGVTVTTRIAYENVALSFPPECAETLRHGAVVLLHSAAAARHFGQECDRLAIARGGIHLAALGPRIAAAAGNGWAACRSAEMPRDAALLALARDMCQGAGGETGRSAR